MKRYLPLVFAVLLSLTSKADEGMWLLSLIEKNNISTMQSMGCKLSADDIYSINKGSLKDAVVNFGGFCTGEIVSPKGLVFTNHHCGYDAIQELSTVENNYLDRGFWAMSHKAELPVEGLTVTFLIRMEDVTQKISQHFTPGMDEPARQASIDEAAATLTKEAVEATHYIAEVENMFGGNDFYLFVYEIFEDVRLVGAPPSSIGKYGGDTDNWMWPRHTGDFSIFRVYSGPDGKPASYSPENIPLNPRHFLPISLKGVKEDDFAMVMGYPGGTQRYMTSFEVTEVQAITHPNRINIRGLRQDILKKDMQADKKVQLQYASKYSTSSNYWKFSIGQSKMLDQMKVYDKKSEQEKAFLEWMDEKPVRKEKYGEALKLVEDAVSQRKDLMHARQYIVESMLRGSEIFFFSQRMKNLERVFANSSSTVEEKSSAIDKMRTEGEKFYKDFNTSTDRKVAIALIDQYVKEVPGRYHPSFLNPLATKYKGNSEKFVNSIYEKSLFANKERFNAFLNSPEISKLHKDPVYQAGRSIYDMYFDISESLREINVAYNKGMRLYINGLREMHSERVFYPDANFTMRMTYGKVDGYYPRDAVYYDYLTTIKGLIEKEDATNPEFFVDKKMKDLYAQGDYGRYGNDGELYVNFISNNDITGGNSGSPVIDAHGNLIGIAFDGNWEAMSGDVVFDNNVQKTISVDIRYVLFVIDKFAGATNIINELKIVE